MMSRGRLVALRGARQNQVSHIYHITSLAAWEAAQRAGEYRAASLESDGFIHFSRRGQVLEVANSFYEGDEGLVLLEVDTALLHGDLRLELPAGLPPPEGSPPGERFPHLYGPLNLDAVVAVHDFSPDPDGTFSLPPGLRPEL
jgi:uncharacterized protein (DUF952 family)